MKLPGVAIAYIVTVILGGLALVAIYALGEGVGWPPSDVGVFEGMVYAGLFTLAAFLADMYPIQIPITHVFDPDTNGDTLLLSSSVYLAALLLFGPAFTIFVAGVSSLLSDLWRRKPLYKAAFNSGQYVLTVGISGLFLLGRGSSPHSFQPWVNSLEGFGALLATLITYFLLNSSLVAGVLAMIQGTRFVDVWKHANHHILPQYAGLLNVGVMAAILWTVTPSSLVLLVIPLVLVHLASKSAFQMKLQTTQALISISGMVDSRDSYAYHHSQEVARYATQMAVHIGLPLEQIEMIRLAAQLHDIGKIGTPDHVLRKPGRLTDEERAVMEEHAEVGARVLQYFSQFRDGSEMVMAHQEHYDGTGYPRRLARNDIPLGARLIHVADAYQAMTSNRIYRNALGHEEALRRLEAGKGTDFDPEAVEAMIAVLQEAGAPEEAAAVEPAAAPALSPLGSV